MVENYSEKKRFIVSVQFQFDNADFKRYISLHIGSKYNYNQ